MVLYYPFNGNANDESGHNLQGEVNGAKLIDDKNNNDLQAYLFDGIDDYITVTNKQIFNFTNSFSISIWAKGVSGNPNPKSFTGIVGKGPGIPYGLCVDDGDRILFRVVSSGDYIEAITTDVQVDTSIWNHYVGVFQAGNSINLYLNGDLIANRTAAIPDIIDSDQQDLWIGARAHSESPTFPTYFFKGCLDEVRLYNRAITEEEVFQLSQL